MPDPYWLKIARKLPVNQNTKIECCKKDNSMNVVNGEHGFMAHCFRCGAKHFEKHGDFSISVLKRRAAEKEFADNKKAWIPNDTVPLHNNDASFIWCLSVGVTGQMARDNGLLYSPSLDRIIIPVYRKGRLVYVQARSLKSGPKYLNTGKVDSALFQPLRKADSPYVVITEDALSSIVVASRSFVDARSTMGTSMSDVQATAISETGKTPIIWYDNDPAGIKGAYKAMVKLKLRGLDPRPIRTLHDPKKYTGEEINEIILEAIDARYNPT